MAGDRQSAAIEALLAEFRALAKTMAMQGLPTLLTYEQAARQMGLKVTQFKVKYVRTKRLDVIREPGMHPRVAASEIRRLVSEMLDAASQRSHGSRKTPARPAHSHRGSLSRSEGDRARAALRLRKKSS